MKTHYKEKTLKEILKYRPKRLIRPLKVKPFYRFILKAATFPHLHNVNFTPTFEGFENYSKKDPILILMNHASFIDIELGAVMFHPRPLNIVASNDAFLRKNWIMRRIGCIPTKRFVMDINLVKNMLYCVKNLKSSVLLYPEAGYSIDGLNGVLPTSLGKMIKLLKIPVAVCLTEGAFHYQPMYNHLHKHKIHVKAHAKIVFSKEDVNKLSVDEINDKLQELFTLDYWKWQKDNNFEFKEDNYCEGLEKILYKCPHCHKELTTIVEGNKIKCTSCNATYEMKRNGELVNLSGKTLYNSVSSWVNYEREEVKKEINNGTYDVKFPVDVLVTFDSYKIFKLKNSNAYLEHNINGITLTDDANDLSFHLFPIELYNMYTEFDWFEVGDMVSIGNSEVLYDCILKNYDVSVLKLRMACQELYKIAIEKIKK